MHGKGNSNNHFYYYHFLWSFSHSPNWASNFSCSMICIHFSLAKIDSYFFWFSSNKINQVNIVFQLIVPDENRLLAVKINYERFVFFNVCFFRSFISFDLSRGVSLERIGVLFLGIAQCKVKNSVNYKTKYLVSWNCNLFSKIIHSIAKTTTLMCYS